MHHVAAEEVVHVNPAVADAYKGTLNFWFGPQPEDEDTMADHPLPPVHGLGCKDDETSYQFNHM